MTPSAEPAAARPRILPTTALVTGGAGFIGSHIVGRLASDGIRVYVLDDLSSTGGHSPSLPSGVELIEADVSEPGAVELIARVRPGAVIHAAAQVSVAASMDDPDRDRRINVRGTHNALEGAKRGGADRFVFLSSGGAIYGEAQYAYETDLPRPASYYGLHKLAAEGYVRLSGLAHANLRLSNVYGPGQRADLEGGVVAILVENLRAGEPVLLHGTGEQSRDFVYVDDVVEAVVAAAVSDRNGTWNVATGRSTSVLALLSGLELLLGPARAVRHERRREGDVAISCLAIDLIRRDLGWSPALSLEAGLAILTAAQSLTR